MNPNPSWSQGLFWYAVATILVVIGIWLWDRSANRHIVIRGVATLLAILTAYWAFHGPVVQQYRREHPSQRAQALPQPGSLEPSKQQPVDQGEDEASREDRRQAIHKSTKSAKHATPPTKPGTGPASERIGSDNTLVNVTNPPSMGDGNTIIGPTDGNGNTILNKGGLAIGSGARAEPTSIAIGAHANAVSQPILVNNAPHGIANSGTIQQATVNNYGPPARSILPDDRDKLVVGLSAIKARVRIIATGTDNEAFTFAQILLELFKDAHWDVEGETVGLVVPASRMPPGVRIGFHGELPPSSSTAIEIDDRTLPGMVIRLMTDAHIRGLYVKRAPDVAEGRLEIWVNANPEAQ